MNKEQAKTSVRRASNSEMYRKLSTQEVCQQTRRSHELDMLLCPSTLGLQAMLVAATSQNIGCVLAVALGGKACSAGIENVENGGQYGFGRIRPGAFHWTGSQRSKTPLSAPFLVKLKRRNKGFECFEYPIAGHTHNCLACHQSGPEFFDRYIASHHPENHAEQAHETLCLRSATLPLKIFQVALSDRI